jgi:hypothetical protein
MVAVAPRGLAAESELSRLTVPPAVAEQQARPAVALSEPWATLMLATRLVVSARCPCRWVG